MKQELDIVLENGMSDEHDVGLEFDDGVSSLVLPYSNRLEESWRWMGEG